MKLLSIRKDSKRREWVVMKDPVTGEEGPRHYSLDSFNCRLDDRGNKRHGIFSYFFKRNNNIVNVATEWGIDLGEDYDRFFQQGLRVSQQISVPTNGVGRVSEYDGFEERPKTFAEICEEDLNERSKALEEKLIGEVKQAKRRRRNEQYDSVVPVLEEGVSPEDSQAVRDLVTRLKEIEISEPSSLFGEPSFVEKADYLKRDENEELLQELPRVDSNLRHLFLNVVKYSELNGDKNNWFRYDLREFSDYLTFIGPECGRLHLDSLLMSLQRGENIYDFRKLVGYDTEDGAKKERFREYFASIFDIQRRGYEGDAAVALTDARFGVPKDQRDKYDTVLRKITDAGFKQFSIAVMDHIARRRPEVLEDPTIVDGVIDVYKTSGEREAYYSFLRSAEERR